MGSGRGAGEDGHRRGATVFLFALLLLPAVTNCAKGPYAVKKLKEVCRIPSSESASRVYLSWPIDVVAAQRRIYVCDAQLSMVFEFDDRGHLLGTIGRYGHGPGELDTPSALFVRGDTLLVADVGNRRLTFFTRDGIYIGQEELPTAAGSIASDGRLVYVAPLSYPGVARQGDIGTVVTWELGHRRKVRKLGHFLSFMPSLPKNDSRGKVASCSDTVWFAFRFFPLLWWYAPSLGRVSVVDVSHIADYARRARKNYKSKVALPQRRSDGTSVLKLEHLFDGLVVRDGTAYLAVAGDAVRIDKLALNERGAELVASFVGPGTELVYDFDVIPTSPDSLEFVVSHRNADGPRVDVFAVELTDQL